MHATLKHSAGIIPLRKQAIDDLLYKQAISLQKAIVQTNLPLDSYVLKKPMHATTMKSSRHVSVLTLAILTHLALLYMVIYLQAKPVSLLKPAKPITVSIIVPPVQEVKPELDIMPIIEPVKLEKKPVIKPKKVVEKIVPVENLTQPLFEATTKAVEDKPAPLDEVAAPAVVEKEASKPAPTEEKLELPKFGVAYLNNPAPDYPGMAKRAGEQGRVLLKVLVTAEGSAESVDIEKTSGYERLDNAAKEAVSLWRFVPARKAGQTLSAYVMVPIKFSLDD